MPVIREHVLLNCTPETAFNEVSSIDFAKKNWVNFSLNVDFELPN